MSQDKLNDANRVALAPPAGAAGATNEVATAGAKKARELKRAASKAKKKEENLAAGAAGAQAAPEAQLAVVKAPVDAVTKQMQALQSQIAKLANQIESGVPAPAAGGGDAAVGNGDDTKPGPPKGFKPIAQDKAYAGKTLCHKFIAGTCPQGGTNDCKKAHVNFPQGKTSICTFFNGESRGCRFGDDCRSWHHAVGKAACEYLISLKPRTPSQSPGAEGRKGKSKGELRVCQLFLQGKCNDHTTCGHFHLKKK